MSDRDQEDNKIDVFVLIKKMLTLPIKKKKPKHFMIYIKPYLPMLNNAVETTFSLLNNTNIVRCLSDIAKIDVKVYTKIITDAISTSTIIHKNHKI